jgi:hypothetical protein
LEGTVFGYQPTLVKKNIHQSIWRDIAQEIDQRFFSLMQI